MFCTHLNKTNIFRLAPRLVGVLLLTASSAKATAFSWAAFSTATAGLILVEAALGWLLVIACWPRSTIPLAGFVFVGFTGVTLRGVLLGEASCGCLGPLEVSPRVMLGVDIASLALLAAGASGPSPHQPVGRYALWGFAPLLAGLLMLMVSTTADDAAASVARARGREVIRPAQWLGHSLSTLADEGDIEQLRTGCWAVLFVKSGCARCDQKKAQYLEAAKQLGPTAAYQFAFMEISPRGEAADRSEPSGVKRLQLPSPLTYVGPTPLELIVREGVVVGVNRFDAEQRTHEVAAR